MTKEQIAQARRLASDMGLEPSHPEMNRAGDVMDRLLDEREALLRAAKDLRGLVYNAFRVIGDSREKIETHVSIVAADAAIAKAEAE